METEKITGKQILIQQVEKKYGFSPSEETVDNIYDRVKGDNETVDVNSFAEVFCNEYNLNKDDEELMGYFNTIASAIDDDLNISLEELSLEYEVNENTQTNVTYTNASNQFKELQKTLKPDELIAKYIKPETTEQKYMAGQTAKYIVNQLVSTDEPEKLKELANNLDYNSRIQNIKNNPPARYEELKGKFLQGDKTTKDALMDILEAAKLHEENLSNGISEAESFSQGAISYNEAMYFISQMPSMENSEQLIQTVEENKGDIFHYIPTLFNMIAQNDEMQAQSVANSSVTYTATENVVNPNQTPKPADEIPKDEKPEEISADKLKQNRADKLKAAKEAASKTENVSKTIDGKALEAELLYTADGLVSQVGVDGMVFDFTDEGLKDYKTSTEGSAKIYTDENTQTEVKDYYGSDGIISTRKITQNGIILTAIYDESGKIAKIKGDDISVPDSEALWVSQKTSETPPSNSKNESETPKEDSAISPEKLKENRNAKLKAAKEAASKTENVSKTLDGKALEAELLYTADGLVGQVGVDGMVFDFTDNGLKDYETSTQGSAKVYTDKNTQTVVKDYYGSDNIIASRKITQNSISLTAIYDDSGKIIKIKGEDLSISDNEALWLSQSYINSKEEKKKETPTTGDNEENAQVKESEIQKKLQSEMSSSVYELQKSALSLLGSTSSSIQESTDSNQNKIVKQQYEKGLVTNTYDKDGNLIKSETTDKNEKILSSYTKEGETEQIILNDGNDYTKLKVESKNVVEKVEKNDDITVSQKQQDGSLVIDSITIDGISYSKDVIEKSGDDYIITTQSGDKVGLKKVDGKWKTHEVDNDGNIKNSTEMQVDGKSYIQMVKDHPENADYQAKYLDAKARATEIIDGNKKHKGINKALNEKTMDPLTGILMLEILSSAESGYGEYVQKALQSSDDFFIKSMKNFASSSTDVETCISFYKEYIYLQKDDDLGKDSKKLADVYINLYKQASMQGVLSDGTTDAVQYVKDNLKASPGDIADMIQNKFSFGTETEKLKSLIGSLGYETKVSNAAIPQNAEGLKSQYIKTKNKDTLKGILEAVQSKKISTNEALYLLSIANEKGSTLQGRNQLIDTFRDLSDSLQNDYIKTLYSIVS